MSETIDKKMCSNCANSCKEANDYPCRVCDSFDMWESRAIITQADHIYPVHYWCGVRVSTGYTEPCVHFDSVRCKCAIAATLDNPKCLRYVHKVRLGPQRKEKEKEHSDGSTASYYELPDECTELQDLISYKDMNAQMGEIFRACYRYGQAGHSSKMRDAKKILFYIRAEIARLEKQV